MSVVRRESVSHASRTVCLSRQAECVVVSMCGCACVVAYVWFLIIICPSCSPFCNNNNNNNNNKIFILEGWPNTTETNLKASSSGKENM